MWISFHAARAPGPWWDIPPACDGPDADAVQQYEALLAEVGGLRVTVQRQARAQLSGEGLPVARHTVARRAVELLADHGRVLAGLRP